MSNIDPNDKFLHDNKLSTQQLGSSEEVHALTQEWINLVAKYRYTYLYSFLGRPIIQFPQDMVAMQELIWQIKPDLIIETGIAHGGSLIFSASMLALLDICDAIESGTVIDPKRSNRKVLGIDIDIRAHNRAAIEAHPMASRIQMIQGSSIAPEDHRASCASREIFHTRPGLPRFKSHSRPRACRIGSLCPARLN